MESDCKLGKGWRDRRRKKGGTDKNKIGIEDWKKG
jgi:hypothetical protein